MKKIIVTGVSGFVGKNLLEYFQKPNWSLYPLSLRYEGWPKLIENGCDAIIHLAGKAHDTSNTSQGHEYFKVNRDLTIELFNIFLDSNIKDFFYFSSVKAVADTVDIVLTEEVVGCPLTPYGKSKLEAEEYLLSKELPDGKRLFIIRPCMIHGPGNKGNLNLLYDVVKKGIPWPLGAFENSRSFLSIDNLNFLIEKMIIKSDVKSGVYNFADDGSLSTNRLIVIMSKALGKKGHIWTLNKNLIEKLAKIGDKLSLPLNSERLKKLTESYIVSNQKIKNELGLSILPLSIEEGLSKTIESFNYKAN